MAQDKPEELCGNCGKAMGQHGVREDVYCPDGTGRRWTDAHCPQHGDGRYEGTRCSCPPLADDTREEYGKLVRAIWTEWALEQPNPKPDWLTAWESLPEPVREVDRRIGERVARYAVNRNLVEAVKMVRGMFAAMVKDFDNEMAGWEAVAKDIR